MNISELHNLAIEEVYATNSSFKQALQAQENRAGRDKLAGVLKRLARRLKKVLEQDPRAKLERATGVCAEKVAALETRVERLRQAKEQASLKESLDLLEVGLGEEVQDAKKRRLEAKMRHVKEDLEIEQKNNIALRAQVADKERAIRELEEKVSAAEKGDRAQVTDADLIQRNEELAARVAELEKKKADVDVQISQIKERYKKNYKEKEEMKRIMEDNEQNLEALQQTVENQRRELKAKEEEIEEEKRAKGRDPATERSAEDYQRDLATGNKENERLNSLLDEERAKVERLDKKIVELTEEVKAAKLGEKDSKIKLNLISQTLQSREDTRHLIDAVVEDPRVTEFGTQGGIKSFSFKNIFKDIQKKYVKSKTTSELERKDALEFEEPPKKSEVEEGPAEQEKERQAPVQAQVVVPVQAGLKEPENAKKDSENKMTININNINITHYSLISPTSKGDAAKAPRTIRSLESNQVPGVKVDFKSKLSNSFDLKSLDNKEDFSGGGAGGRDEDGLKKSSLKKLYIPEDVSDSDSSITSLIQKSSPRNSRGDAFGEKGRAPTPNEAQKMTRDLGTLKKNYSGSSGNMIVKNSRVSVNSVTEGFSTSPKAKSLHKSLFAIKVGSKEKELEEEGVETLAKGGSSFNFEGEGEQDLDQSESFDEMFLGGKKEMESGVFSKREINAFEMDENLHLMMEDDDVQPGETVMDFSQRIIAKTTEGAAKNDRRAPPKTAPAKPKRVQGPGPASGPLDKNLFDESFQNETLAFTSNPREPSLLMPPAQILNTNYSFAGDNGAFISGTSFGTNNEINNVLDSIKKHSEREEQLRKEEAPKHNVRRLSASDLKTVPEEGGEEQFEFRLPARLEGSPRGSNQFDSRNSLFELGVKLGRGEERETNMLEFMKGLNTDGIDQKLYDKIFEPKMSKEGTVSSPLQSPSGSAEGMFFGTKRIQEDSDED